MAAACIDLNQRQMAFIAAPDKEQYVGSRNAPAVSASRWENMSGVPDYCPP
jgi:hypothetical protein